MTRQFRVLNYCVVTVVTALSLAACGSGGGGSSPAPGPTGLQPGPVVSDNNPPATDGSLTSIYDGRTFTYTSQDGSCQGTIVLSVNDPNFTVIADNSTCEDLFKQTINLTCYSDQKCIGKVSTEADTVVAQLVDANTITFTVTNDINNQDPRTMTYTSQPAAGGN